jgi:hypothetical protein
MEYEMDETVWTTQNNINPIARMEMKRSMNNKI